MALFSFRPWIITMAHRNFYCCGFDLKDCIGYERLFKKEANYSLEELFNDNGGKRSILERFQVAFND